MKRYLFCIAIIALMYGCTHENKQYASSDDGLNEIVVDSTLSDTTVVPKLMKTADMKFRVKDVQQSKENIAKSLKAQGGEIIGFSIESKIQESDKVKYSLDSLKEITSYRKEAKLTARIPSEQLDDFTNSIAKMAVFVDNQSMHTENQSATYLANKLKAQNRAEALRTIDQTAKRRGNNVETSLMIKDDFVNRKIENMNIDERVKFSTITLDFYQDNTVNTLIIGNDNLNDYAPGFFKRLALNLFAGWALLKELLLGLSVLWPLFLIGIILFIILRYYNKRKNIVIHA